MKRWTAQVASEDVHTLAEGPVWDGPRDRLLWLDIEAGAVHIGALDGERVVRTGTHVVDRTAGAVVSGRTGELLVAGTETLLVVGADGAVTPGPRIVPAGSGRRLNDGACDPDGVFWVGTMRFDQEPGGEVLVRVGADRSVTIVDEGLSLSNGLAWSPDGALFYSVDTTPKVIWVRSGGGPRREFLRPEVSPDGMCADTAGNLWVACHGAGEVRRYAPDGTLTGVVEVGAPNVTCPAFVGPGLDRLLITTAQSDGDPDSGRLFLADVGAVGLPATPWAGFTN
jgi:sugar lactone lactonase YvrE